MAIREHDFEDVGGHSPTLMMCRFCGRVAEGRRLADDITEAEECPKAPLPGGRSEEEVLKDTERLRALERLAGERDRRLRRS